MNHSESHYPQLEETGGNFSNGHPKFIPMTYPRQNPEQHLTALQASCVHNPTIIKWQKWYSWNNSEAKTTGDQK